MGSLDGADWRDSCGMRPKGGVSTMYIGGGLLLLIIVIILLVWVF
jgi:hypothetical protein